MHTSCTLMQLLLAFSFSGCIKLIDDNKIILPVLTKRLVTLHSIAKLRTYISSSAQLVSDDHCDCSDCILYAFSPFKANQGHQFLYQMRTHK